MLTLPLGGTTDNFFDKFIFRLGVIEEDFPNTVLAIHSSKAIQVNKYTVMAHFFHADALISLAKHRGRRSKASFNATIFLSNTTFCAVQLQSLP